MVLLLTLRYIHSSCSDFLFGFFFVAAIVVDSDSLSLNVCGCVSVFLAII